MEKPLKDAKAPQISAIVAMALAHGVPYSYVDTCLLVDDSSDGAGGSEETDNPTKRDGEPREPDIT